MKYIGEKSKKKVNLNLKFVLVHHHQQKQTDFDTLSLQIGAIKKDEPVHNVLFVQYDSPVSKTLGVFFWNLDSVLL